MKIRGRAAHGANADECDEYKKDHGGHGFLEVGAEADAAVVDGGEKQSKRHAQDESRKENGLTSDAVQLERVKKRKNVGGDFSEGDGFPRTNDEVCEKHHPAGEVADDRRENLRRVGGFAGGVGNALDPLAIDVADGKQNDSANGKTECRTRWTATAEPIVHEDQPAGADHGAEGQSEIVVQAKFAREGWHLQDAEQLVQEIGGQE